LLDFGCGVGRVMLSVLKYHPDISRVSGFDIMPQVIQFCDSHIASSFPTTSFELITGSNDHYNDFIAAAGTTGAKSHAQLQAQYAGAFSGIYAFSVFTHVELADFRALLKLLSNLVEPGGQVLFTAFLLTPSSRRAIRERRALFPFAEGPLDTEGDTFVGNATDRLGFIAFDQSLVAQATFDAELVIHHIEYGSWAGTIPSQNLQDVIVCGKPLANSAPVQHVPVVARDRRRAPASPQQPTAVADLRTLLALEGEAFVLGAYAAVLDRRPDPDGLKHYLAELVAGVPKIEIVRRLRNSEEGKKLNRALPGYRQEWLKARLLKS
jgi:SAM-dependent methyltransferase